MASEHELAFAPRSDPLKQVAERLRSELEAMCEETEIALQRELPEVVERADPLIRRRVIEATFRRVHSLLAGETRPDTEAATHVAFGAAAARAGVALETLTAGYRIGARVGWMHLRQAVRDLGLSPDAVLALADAHVAYVDELAANSIEGYAREAELVRGERARERQALLDALLSADATRDDGEALRAGARVAGWPWPERIAVAVLLSAVRGVVSDDRLLVGMVVGAAVAAGPLAPLTAWLTHAGIDAAVGPPAPPERAATSLDRGRRVAGLIAAGVLPSGRVVCWEHELATLVIHADPAAAEALAAGRLAALADPSGARERLLRETLAGWLDHPGQPLAIARALHLHPQTVRYRLGRLRERLGDALDDPHARFELALALRYQGADRGPGYSPRSSRAVSPRARV